MRKPVNIMSFFSLNNESVERKYLKYIGAEERHQSELTELTSLAKLLSGSHISTDNFYIFYSIPHIGKEFDILIFDENNNVINIEMKSSASYEEQKVKKQLLKNKNYLKSISSCVQLFTVNFGNNIIYKLLEDDSLSKYVLTSNNVFDQCDLYKTMSNFKPVVLQNIDFLFTPAKFLVSPFNNTKKFINNEYFLTNEQEGIKKNILDGGFKLFGINASAGTGKTLLCYDIAKELIQLGNKVCIVHVGLLNNGHYTLKNNYGWKIVPIKDFKPEQYENFDYVIFDEIQHANKYSIVEIIETLLKSHVKIVVAGDPKQVISINDIGQDYVTYIEKNFGQNNLKNLTKKIRTNKQVASFIKRLFNLRDTAGSENMRYDNITVNYFNNETDGIEYAKTLISNWNVLTYTTSMFKDEYNKIFKRLEFQNQHMVIGQEFDNVVIFMGKDYYYDNDHLKVKLQEESHYPTRMGLFENITRTRINLKIIVCNNSEVFGKCLEILE
ncbi:AAA family ATPase [Leuconostoc mesenteroides]|uniref:AAA family ATPase n=1 Tax=Leuconostoc mesenteroides TaxID=1245 RepID=UPI0023607287|nr:AAA family ATPase [Leuconostoc mesenteroides]